MSLLAPLRMSSSCHTPLASLAGSCPSGIAFVTTPRGDLNMDGDRYDNSGKLLVKLVGGAPNTGSINEFDNMLTMSSDTAANELVVGDAVMIEEESFVVASVVSGHELRRFALDHDRHTALTHGANIYRHLETIADPKGAWETWDGSFNAAGVDEGHFYMECSNRGVCDRTSGECQCFPGYQGSGCARMECPGNAGACNGHGLCRTVNELRRLVPQKLLGFTISGTAGSAALVPSVNPQTHTYTSNVDGVTSKSMLGLAVGDTLRVGSREGEEHTVASITSTGITLSRALSRTTAFGTILYLVPAYDIWDGDKNRACDCDAGYTGPACADRLCPRGADPMNWYTTAGPTTKGDDGNTEYYFRNEKQNIYLETTRGQLSGTFTLTFTDAFGQRWTTTPIHINERLASKAYVSVTAKTVVTFTQALPQGALEVGDFLMIGDERQEVTGVHPNAETTANDAARPVLRGGVINSVVVRTAYNVASENVYTYRAGPARGIKAALEALPGNVVPDVLVDTFQGGVPIGYHRGGITTASGYSHVLGLVGNQANVAMANVATNGGLAPYDTIRVVSAAGSSEFLKVRNVDVYHTSGNIEALYCKGSATAQTTTGGFGKDQAGAIYRAGGYHLRVNFTSPLNSGNLPELEVDDSGLYSVFQREFTGSVTLTQPRKVECHLHGGALFYAPTAYPYPVPGHASGHIYPYPVTSSGGDSTTFKGDLYDLKVLAGMKMKIGDQVRTVVSDITADATDTASYFFVDVPFTWTTTSEAVLGIKYVFYRHLVEQIYDDSTYNALSLSRALYLPTHTAIAAAGNSALGQGTMTLSAAVSAGATTSWQFSGTTEAGGASDALNTVLPRGTKTTLTTLVAGTASSTVVTVAGTSAATTELVVASQSSTVPAFTKTDAAFVPGNAGAVFRIYDSMALLAATSQTTLYAPPPLTENTRSHWAVVTDQRPLLWSSADITKASTSRVVPSPSGVSRRGLAAGGSGALVFTVGSATGIVLTAAATTLTLSGTNWNDIVSWLSLVDGTGVWNTGVSPVVTITGCAANAGLNAVYTLTAATKTVLTFVANGHGVAGSACSGNAVTVRITTHSHLEGTSALADTKSVVSGDRIKLKRSIASYPGDFETRTVDHVWASTPGHVSMFSVKDEYTTSGSDFTGVDVDAWVDESGNTESVECARRGTCDRESGICECFDSDSSLGHRGVGCEILAM